MSKLKTRKPTGKQPWPFILMEGFEKTGKTFGSIKLSADERIGDTYLLDVGENAADSYSVLPGVEYQIIEHNGTYGGILQQVEAFVSEVPGVVDGRPTLLILDSFTPLWQLIIEDGERAYINKKGGKPDEVKLPFNYWNDIKGKWRRIINMLKQWEGLVVGTARSKKVMVIENGKPLQGVTEYKIEAEKKLKFDVDVHVKATAPGEALFVGGRSTTVPLAAFGAAIPGYKDTGLAGLLFDLMKLSEADVAPRQVTPLEAAAGENGGYKPVPELTDKAAAAEYWKVRKAAGATQVELDEISAVGKTLAAAEEAAVEAEANVYALDDGLAAAEAEDVANSGTAGEALL